MADIERGDHKPDGPRPNDSDDLGYTADESADRKAHGAHGRGHGTENRVDDAPVEPGHAEDDKLGSDGWGAKPSGGSAIDKR